MDSYEAVIDNAIDDAEEGDGDGSEGEGKGKSQKKGGKGGGKAGGGGAGGVGGSGGGDEGEGMLGRLVKGVQIKPGFWQHKDWFYHSLYVACRRLPEQAPTGALHSRVPVARTTLTRPLVRLPSPGTMRCRRTSSPRSC